jgi:predicted HTH domain antitoxin
VDNQKVLIAFEQLKIAVEHIQQSNNSFMQASELSLKDAIAAEEKVKILEKRIEKALEALYRRERSGDVPEHVYHEIYDVLCEDKDEQLSASYVVDQVHETSDEQEEWIPEEPPNFWQEDDHDNDAYHDSDPNSPRDR